MGDRIAGMALVVLATIIAGMVLIGVFIGIDTIQAYKTLEHQGYNMNNVHAFLNGTDWSARDLRDSAALKKTFHVFEETGSMPYVKDTHNNTLILVH